MENLTAIYQYLIDSIYDVDHTQEERAALDTPLKVANFAYERFLGEGYTQDKQKYFCYNQVRALASHLQGLPSYFNVDFRNDLVEEKGKAFGLLSQEADEDSIEEFCIRGWFHWMAYYFIEMRSKLICAQDVAGLTAGTPNIAYND